MAFQRKKIIVIGAGIAGMSASVALSRAGHSVLVLESRKFAGGRTYSFTDETTGDIIDNGQHAMVGAYNNYFELLNELGTINLLHSDEFLTLPIFDKNGKNDVLSTQSVFAKFGMLKGLMGLKLLSKHSKISLLKLLVKIQFLSFNKLEKSVLEFLNENEQGDDTIRYFWEPLTYAVLNSHMEVAPAKLLITVLKKSFLAGKQNARFFLPAVGLSELTEGFEKKLNDYGNEIKFSSPVKELLFSENKVSGIVTENETITEFDYVVSCVPPQVLVKLLPEEVLNMGYFSNFKKIQNSPITSLYLWTDKPLTNHKFAALTGTTAQWLFNKTLLSRKRPDKPDFPFLYSVTISASERITALPSNEIAGLCYNEIVECLKPENPTKLLHYRVIKDKSATMLSSVASQKLRPAQLSPSPNLLIAGDWTNTGLPPTIESAAISGKICANIIMNQ